ncbi:hypothetical protein AMECASPLE_026558 [Ameca splendens]|uniref:Uncharacterized protein n=1 Tax=Ameca splendens TaxID=208324 RepID=A0ABV1AB98_9TELE
MERNCFSRGRDTLTTQRLEKHIQQRGTRVLCGPGQNSFLGSFHTVIFISAPSVPAIATRVQTSDQHHSLLFSSHTNHSKHFALKPQSHSQSYTGCRSVDSMGLNALPKGTSTCRRIRIQNLQIAGQLLNPLSHSHLIKTTKLIVLRY